MNIPDPWEPWAKADAAALSAVFDLPDFESQCRALLELAPHASAKQLSLLPWDERHERSEFRAIRDAWAAERHAKADAAKLEQEAPLEEQVREQFEAAVKVRDLKAADEALKLLVRMGTAKGVRTAAQAQDDFSRLTEREVLMLGALVHKLRGEPLTSSDDELLAYLALVDADASPEQPSS